MVFPLLLGQGTLFVNSVRKEGQVFTEGSVYPGYLFNSAYPYSFDKGDGYFGVNLNSEYFMQEFYFYIGISVLIIGLFIFGATLDKKLRNFFVISVGLFVLLACIKTFNFFGDDILYWLFWPFSLFRYWTRAVIGVVFAFSLIVGKFFTEKISFKWKVSRYKELSIIIFSSVLLQLLNINNEVITYFKVFFKSLVKVGPINLIYFLILLLSVVAAYLIYKKHKYVKLLVTIIISADILLFWFFSGANLFRDINSFKFNIYGDSYSAERVVDLSGDLGPQNYLQQNTWSIFGYSVFVRSGVYSLVKDIGFRNVRYPILEEEITKESLVKELEKLGVSHLILEDKKEIHLKGDIIELDYDSILKEEGYFSIVSDIDISWVKTKISYYWGWSVLINEKEVPVRVNKEGFLEFRSDSNIEGAVIEIKYMPYPLIYGTIISILLIPFNFLVYKAYKLSYAENKRNTKRK
jgi:hypothetical protein